MTGITDIARWVALVVDDEEDNREAAVAVLEFHGIPCYEACDGQEALRLMEAVTPTVVLTDLSMPVMDGWALLSRMRKSPHLAHVPIIALTAHAMQGDRERALAAGFNGYLTKPFNVRTFIADIAQILLPAMWKSEEVY